MKAAHPDKIKIFQVNCANLPHDKVANFLTIDEKGYRFEISDKKKEKSLVEGVINFGDDSGTKSMNDVFLR